MAPAPGFASKSMAPTFAQTPARSAHFRTMFRTTLDLDFGPLVGDLPTDFLENFQKPIPPVLPQENLAFSVNNFGLAAEISGGLRLSWYGAHCTADPRDRTDTSPRRCAHAAASVWKADMAAMTASAPPQRTMLCACVTAPRAKPQQPAMRRHGGGGARHAGSGASEATARRCGHPAATMVGSRSRRLSSAKSAGHGLPRQPPKPKHQVSSTA